MYVRVLHPRGTDHPICDLSRIIANRQLDAFTVPPIHYVSNKCIYFQSQLFAGTNSIAIDLMTMKDWFFSQHWPPAPRHHQSCHFFLLAVVIASDCAMTLAFHALGNPFAYHRKDITRTFCYSRGKCSFWLIQPIYMYWRAFPVGSRHISARFYVC